MSTTGCSLSGDGMYSKLIDDEANYEEHNRRPDVGHSVHPVSPVRVASGPSGPGPSGPGPSGPGPSGPRPSGPGPYRLATICLATLCAVLLISIIAVSVRYKSEPPAGGETTSETQKQTQDEDVSALTASVHKLQLEKEQLQKEKEELLAKMAAERTTEAPNAVQPMVCPADWQLFNDSCYFISRNTRSWPGSKSYCESQGAYLAIIHTAAEQQFLWDLLPRGHWNAFWFGITDGHTEDRWKWVDGTPLVGGFWEVGEPNNHIDEDCGYIVKTRVLERVAIRSWYDAPCTMDWPFICEKEAGPAH